MSPQKVNRHQLHSLTDLPNIGNSIAADLQLLGINSPQQLVGCNAYEMYVDLCTATGQRHDPCVLDVFISITRFMDGDEPQPWWAYTAERKRAMKDKAGKK